MLLTKNEIDLLSFPDTEVLQFVLDIPGKKFLVSCSDGYVDLDSGGRTIQNVTLEIKGFTNFEIKEFANEKMIVVEKYSVDFALKDVCEFIVDSQGIVLKGFSKRRGYWTEYFFSGGILSGNYES